jgi:hypothetical protein
MIDFSVDVDTKVPAAFSELAGTLYMDVVNDAIHPYLNSVRDKAKRKHRFKSRSGKLERSVRSNLNEDGGSVYLDEGLAPYASYIHEGSDNISADPFLDDAFNESELDRLIDKVIDKSIKDAGI